MAYTHFNNKSPESDRQGGCEATGIVHIRKYVFPMKSGVLVFVTVKGSPVRALNLVLLLQINTSVPRVVAAPEKPMVAASGHQFHTGQ